MTLNQIFIKVAFIGNITYKMENSFIYEFSIIKIFNVNLYPPKVPRIIEVLWMRPASGWLKCNTNNSFSSDWASWGGLFRNHLGDFFLVLLRRLSALPRLLQSFLELLRRLILLLALVGVIFGWKLIPLLFCWLLRISLWFLNILGSYGSIV